MQVGHLWKEKGNEMGLDSISPKYLEITVVVLTWFTNIWILLPPRKEA